MAQNTSSTISGAHLVSRMNNFRHGGCAETLFLTTDNPEEFFSLLENAFEQHLPQFDQDADFVTDSVRARWIFNRRQRACEQYENQLHERKPDGKYFKPDPDITEIMLFDRYVTNAERAMYRALKNLQLVQKMNGDKARTKHLFEEKKMSFTEQVDLWKQAVQREELLAAKLATQEQAEDAEAKPPVQPVTNEIPNAHLKSAGVKLEQVIYLGLEQGKTVVYEVTPSNDQIRREIQSSDKVFRTYNFVGGVPEAYKHLISPDAVSWGKSTTVTKIYNYGDWLDLMMKE